MATKIWLGGASTTAQVDTLTVGGTIENDDVFIVTLTAEDGTTTSVTVDGPDHGGNATSVTAALQSECAASTHPLFAAITWTNPTSTTVVATAKVAGVPFYLSVSTTEAGGVTMNTSSFSMVPPTVSVSTWAVVLAPPSQIFVAMSQPPLTGTPHQMPMSSAAAVRTASRMAT